MTLAEVAPLMQQAMVAAEDTRFYEHHGVDAKGVARAFVANQSSGETAQGASTLTMQYVRLAIEYSATSPQDVVDATSNTPGRKIREMRYALALEKQLTKQQILERYLNLAPFGGGAFGIYAASQVFFGKLPKDLTLGEASLIAGLVQAPSDYNPLTPEGLKQAKERRNSYVLLESPYGFTVPRIGSSLTVSLRNWASSKGSLSFTSGLCLEECLIEALPQAGRERA